MLSSNIFGVYQLMHLELIDTPGQEEYTQLRVHPFQGFVLLLVCFIFCAALSPFIDEALIKKVIFRGRCVSSLFLLGQ